MKLVKVSKDVLINPEKISAVEMRTNEGVRNFKVIAEGYTYLVEVDPQEFLAELLASGVEAHQQFFSL